MIFNDAHFEKKLSTLEVEIDNLKQQIVNLGKVVEETAAELGKIRQESILRCDSLSNEMTEMESRLMTRLEELETARPEEAESDILTDETPARGVKRWSERKREIAAKNADPGKWKLPSRKEAKDGAVSSPVGSE